MQQITTSIPNIPLATIHDGAGWVEDPALNSVLSAFAAGHDTGEKCRNYLMNNQLDSVTFGSFRFNQDGSVPSIVEVVDYVSGK